jgi:basic amino acid/polyamine antiporter, APA family
MTELALDNETSVTPKAGGAREELGFWDAVSLIVGVVIGAGIYETAPLVLANVPNAGAGLLLWFLGGALSLAGAACYAELASAYPRSGGDYFYLTRAFGPLAGFLFGWAQLAVILTGSIGMMAYVFADYAAGLGIGRPALVAALVVLALTLLNVASVRSGKRTQNALTIVKVVGLSAVVIAGFASGVLRAPEQELAIAAAATQPGTAATAGSLGLAMILVLYTFGGWNDAAFVAAEVRDKRRNVARALLFGTALITLVYLLVNAAFLAGLGFDEARQSRTIAADLFERSFGAPGRVAISLLVMVSALGAANALIFTGSRVVASLGEDYRGLAALGRWPQRFGSPVWALLLQGSIAVVLIGLVGTGAGRALAVASFGRLGLSHSSFEGHGGFDTLLRCTAPVFWIFFLLTGLSLFVLRFRDREIERPFRVPLFPIVPLVFVGTCAFMLYSSLDYAGPLVLVTLPFLLFGMPFYFTRRLRGVPSPPRRPAPRAQQAMRTLP